MANAYITTSWDDGHPGDIRIGDMLDAHGLTGTFYAPRDADTGVMTTAQLRDLAQRHEIGGHTLDHVTLLDCDDATANAEIVGSRKWVEDVTGKACTMFCPPRGKFASQHVQMVADAGYAGLRTVQLLSTDPPSVAHPVPIMPTTLQVFPHASSSYMKNAVKRRSMRGLMRCIFDVRGRHWLDMVDPFLDHVTTHGGVFHLWGHAWEIDRLDQWAMLDKAFAKLSQRNTIAPCVTNGALCAQMQTMAI